MFHACIRQKQIPRGVIGQGSDNVLSFCKPNRFWPYRRMIMSWIRHCCAYFRPSISVLSCETPWFTQWEGRGTLERLPASVCAINSSVVRTYSTEVLCDLTGILISTKRHNSTAKSRKIFGGNRYNMQVKCDNGIIAYNFLRYVVVLLCCT